MKLKQIAFAVAALAAGSAHAFTPDLAIYLDGATATKKSVEDVAKYMCKAGTLGTGDYQVYKDSGNKYNAVYCPVDGDKAGIADGTKVFLAKNNKDGSLEALQRALMRQTIDGGVPVNSNAAGESIELDPATCNSATKVCGTHLVPAIGGLSDVNANVWADRVQFSADLVDGGYTEYPAVAAQAFGVAVTGELYKALQAAQGHTVGVPADGLNLTAADLANQPNITRAQFASILGGYYTADWSPIVGAAGAGKNVNLCRRGTNSGTQASMDSFFMNYPCSPSAAASVLASDSSATFKVIENAGTGDVKTCLTSRNVPGNVNSFAVGIMSSENTWASGDGWYYVKLDGVSMNEDASQRKATTEGRYNFMEEMYGVVRNDADADAQAYMANFFAAMGAPDKVTPLPGISVVPGTYLWNPTDSDLIRVNRGTRGGDACAPMLLVN